MTNDSVLSYLLFNVFLCALFFFLCALYEIVVCCWSPSQKISHMHLFCQMNIFVLSLRLDQGFLIPHDFRAKGSQNKHE